MQHASNTKECPAAKASVFILHRCFMSLNKDHVSSFRGAKHSCDVSPSGRDLSPINGAWDESPYLKNILAEVPVLAAAIMEAAATARGNR